MASAISPDRTRSVAAFVGRERELAELRASLEDVSDGHGRLFLLSGEPGIGKTTLADEFARLAAAQGAHVVWGRCWEGGGAPPCGRSVQMIHAGLSGSARG